MLRAMRRTIGPTIGIAVVCGLLSACSAFAPQLTAPRLSIVNAGLLSADVFSQQFRVRLHVDNPNDRALPIKKIDYEIFLEGDSFAEGASLAPFTVPANDTAEFDLIVKTNFMSGIGRLLSRLGSGNNLVHYSMTGKVAVDISMLPAMPFNESGTFELRRR